MTVVMDNELTCCVCLELFTSPHMLPCSHNYCKKCIEDLVHHSNLGNQQDGEHRRGRGKQLTWLSCPKCRRDVYLDHRRGVESLPANRVLENIVKVYESSLADGDYETLQCPLAEDCKVRRCPEHKKPLYLFCQTCNKAVCDQCMTKLHAGFGHVVKTTAECIFEEQEKVYSSLQELGAAEVDMKNKLEDVDYQITALKSQECQLHHMLDEEFKSLSSMLDMVKARLKEETTASSLQLRRPLEHLASKYAMQQGHSRSLHDQLSKIHQQKDAQRRLMLLKQVGLNLSSFLAFKQPMSVSSINNSMGTVPLQQCYLADTEKVMTVIKGIRWRETPGLLTKPESKDGDKITRKATDMKECEKGTRSSSVKSTLSSELKQRMWQETDKPLVDVVSQGARPKVFIPHPTKLQGPGLFRRNSLSDEEPVVHRVSPCQGLKEQLAHAVEELHSLSKNITAEKRCTGKTKRSKHSHVVGEIGTHELRSNDMSSQLNTERCTSPFSVTSGAASSSRGSSPASDQSSAASSQRYGEHRTKASKVFIAPAKLHLDGKESLWSLAPRSSSAGATVSTNFLMTSVGQETDGSSAQVVSVTTDVSDSPFKSAFLPRERRSSAYSGPESETGPGSKPTGVNNSMSELLGENTSGASVETEPTSRSPFLFGSSNSLNSSFNFSKQILATGGASQSDERHVLEVGVCATSATRTSREIVANASMGKGVSDSAACTTTTSGALCPGTDVSDSTPPTLSSPLTWSTAGKPKTQVSSGLKLGRIAPNDYMVDTGSSPQGGHDFRAEASANDNREVSGKDGRGVGTSIKTGFNSAVCTIKNLCRVNFSSPGRSSLDLNPNSKAAAAATGTTTKTQKEEERPISSSSEGTESLSIFAIPKLAAERKLAGVSPNAGKLLVGKPGQILPVVGKASSLSEVVPKVNARSAVNTESTVASTCSLADEPRRDSKVEEAMPPFIGVENELACSNTQVEEPVVTLKDDLITNNWDQFIGSSKTYDFSVPANSWRSAKPRRHNIRKGKRRN